MDAVDSHKPIKAVPWEAGGAACPVSASIRTTAAPTMVDPLRCSSPLRPLGGTITVPEGCGLVSTSVSAALDKATELLNNTGNELLPVKDLLHPGARSSFAPGSAGLTQA
eukprot:scaffold183202_cov45-Prasinocladus_malaysianus.AAC.1